MRKTDDRQRVRECGGGGAGKEQNLNTVELILVVVVESFCKNLNKSTPNEILQ